MVELLSLQLSWYGDVKSVFGTTDGTTGIHTFGRYLSQLLLMSVFWSTPRDQGGISTVTSTNPLFQEHVKRTV